ncbi:putative hexokinase, partial [Corchorus olitorius]
MVGELTKAMGRDDLDMRVAALVSLTCFLLLAVISDVLDSTYDAFFSSMGKSKITF